MLGQIQSGHSTPSADVGLKVRSWDWGFYFSLLGIQGPGGHGEAVHMHIQDICKIYVIFIE